ncbi:hypothetical protein BC829DRAFT_408393 [Chytridium lagenaria]|nr:hypothetical protein BC829DRAFT_408393 [Chytridium lagenaria]
MNNPVGDPYNQNAAYHHQYEQQASAYGNVNYDQKADAYGNSTAQKPYANVNYDQQWTDQPDKVEKRPNFDDVPNAKMLDAVGVGEEVKPDKKKKNRDSLMDRSRLRGCLPRSPLFKIICVAVIVAILVVLAVFGYFFWPRYILKAFYCFLFSTFLLGGVSSAKGNLNKIKIKLNLLMNISCYNENLYDLQIEEIALDAWLIANDTLIAQAQNPKDFKPPLEPLIGPAPVGRDPNYVQKSRIQIGKANKTSMVFPSRQNKTFPMNFELSYEPDPQVGLLEDKAFKEFMSVCGITSPRKRNTRIEYTARSTVGFLKTLGGSRNFPGVAIISCPINDAFLTNVFNYYNVYPNATAEEILSNAFGTNFTIVSG